MSLGGNANGKRRRHHRFYPQAGGAPGARAVTRRPVRKTYSGRLPVSGTPEAAERARRQAERKAIAAEVLADLEARGVRKRA